MRRLRWLSYFAWVPLFGLLLGLGLLATRTQMIFAWEFTGPRNDPFYLRCTYAGLPGVTTLPAEGGRCAWLRLDWQGGR